MNQWQEIYCNEYYNGKKPRSKAGKSEYELLSVIKSCVVVEFPQNGSTPAHTETYTVTPDECDIPNGKISVCVLVSNSTRLVLSKESVYDSFVINSHIFIIEPACEV